MDASRRVALKTTKRIRQPNCLGATVPRSCMAYRQTECTACHRDDEIWGDEADRPGSDGGQEPRSSRPHLSHRILGEVAVRMAGRAAPPTIVAGPPAYPATTCTCCTGWRPVCFGTPPRWRPLETSAEVAARNLVIRCAPPRALGLQPVARRFWCFFTAQRFGGSALD
jgi:hypothetical protein